MNTNLPDFTNSHTYREIMQQPDAWHDAYTLLINNKNYISDFVSKHMISEFNVSEQQISKHGKIIFVGAGTSAFIGDTLATYYSRRGYTNCMSVPTTDIVTNPEVYLCADDKITMVSFARSGNSPESIAAVELANKLCKEVVHVIITCNIEGALAKNVTPQDLLLLLPPQTNDLSLAMTSSFSTMLLVGALLADFDMIDKMEKEVNTLSSIAKDLIVKYMTPISKITTRPFSRAIFLGSAELKGIAEECHLKLQEMTDGKVICKFDSFLGFRHGPKAAINENTLLVYLLSQEDHAFTYEQDLINQINVNNKVIGQIAVTPAKCNISNDNLDIEIKLIADGALNFIAYVLVGQLLALYTSVSLGHNPDSPSISGNIARVVEGVVIYDYV